MKRKASGIDEKCNLHLGKTKLPGSSMFRLGIKTRNIQKLRCSRESESFRAMGILILMLWMGIWDPEAMRQMRAESSFR
uniref:Uncharacterized protein n=1 Tax=Oryza glumipatula TaxID=40148 RepID=A0A0E0BMM9_9ORYZ